jgi:signal peptidase I
MDKNAEMGMEIKGTESLYAYMEAKNGAGTDADTEAKNGMSANADTKATNDTGADTKARGAMPSALRELLSLLVKIAVICGIAALGLTFVYGLHRNADADMTPAVKDGDLVVFYRLDKDYAAGDIVILSYEGERQARRVVAIGGDTVDITEDGLLVNGALQQEFEIYENTPRYAEGIDLPVTVNEGAVFVLGDSRENATDSRIYGEVKVDDTQGTVVAVARHRGL